MVVVVVDVDVGGELWIYGCAWMCELLLSLMCELLCDVCELLWGNM